MSEQPIHYAVLVPRECVSEPLASQFDGEWACIYANGDLATARETASEFSREHHGQPAVVMQYVDHVTAGVVTTWAKPNV
jgi:hypothetical protein